MGRKIEMKKIQNNTKCQVTFSKRRKSLITKAEEISISCDVDVAFLAFSPSGRISKFCNLERMEDLLDRYVNLPVEKRLSHINNVQSIMEKLQELGSIENEDDRLRYLDNQIENLKLQIDKNQFEVQLAESNLGDFELHPEQKASVHQVSWCVRNLQQAIEKVKEKQKEIERMENEGAMPWLYQQGGNSHHFSGSTSSNGQLHMQFESWRNNPYIDRYPENIFHVMLPNGKGKELVHTSISPSYSNMHQFGVPETQSGSYYNLLQQPDSNFSFGTHADNYQSGFPERNFDNVTNTTAAPLTQGTLSTYGVPSDLHDFFPSEDTLGDNTSWNQNIWDFDNLKL